MPGEAQLEFRPIDPHAHAELCVRFREDTAHCAYGSTITFHGNDGNGAARYLDWLRERLHKLPGSAVFLHDGEQVIGQIEMSLLESAEGPQGYVHLFYLVPERRGEGLGRVLESYARSFLQRLGCRTLRLSVSPANQAAWRFYRSSGWRDLGPRNDAPALHLLEKSEAAGVPIVGSADGDVARWHFRKALKLDQASREAEAIDHYRNALALGLDERDEVIAILGLGSSLRVMGRAQESLQTLSALAHTNNAAFLFHALALYDSAQYASLAQRLLARLLQVLVERQDDDVMPFRAPLERYIRNLATPGDGGRL